MDATKSLAGSKITVRRIMLQFSFSNEKVVPKGIPELTPESVGEAMEREHRADGEQVIAPVENVDLLEFVGELIDNGYELASAASQERVNPRNPGNTYYMVRFVFVPEEDVNRENEAGDNMSDLKQMCKDAMWRVKVFVNPFISDGEEVAGQHVVSINMTSRKPLYNNVGKPIRVWQKDESGERIGDVPVPVRPNYVLSFVDDVIEVVPEDQAKKRTVN